MIKLSQAFLTTQKFLQDDFFGLMVGNSTAASTAGAAATIYLALPAAPAAPITRLCRRRLEKRVIFRLQKKSRKPFSVFRLERI